jgi:hypothetical protein
LWGAFMCTLPFNSLLVSDDGLTIDGTTQTDFAGDMNPDGAEIGLLGVDPNSSGSPAFYVQSNGNTFRGIGRVHWRGTMAEIEGDDNRVVGCSIFDTFYSAVELVGSNNIIGGTGPADGNLLSSASDGVRISGPGTGNRIIGNHEIQGSDHGVHIRIGAAGNFVGGPTAAERNLITRSGHTGEHGLPLGGHVFVESNANVIEGNYIGTDATGMSAPIHAAYFGVLISKASGNVVRGNLIGGHVGSNRTHYGILVEGDSQSTLIADNRIGINAAGTGPLPNGMGIGVQWGFIPEPPPGACRIEGNQIAFNQMDGIHVGTLAATGVTITRNSIHDNTWLAIDLNDNQPVVYPDTVTVNDAGDPDGGTNALLNFPMILSAVDTGFATQVSGQLDTLAPGSATVELFVSDALVIAVLTIVF